MTHPTWKLSRSTWLCHRILLLLTLSPTQVVDLPNPSKTSGRIDWSGLSNGDAWVALITFLYLDFLDATGAVPADHPGGCCCRLSGGCPACHIEVACRSKLQPLSDTYVKDAADVCLELGRSAQVVLGVGNNAAT